MKTKNYSDQGPEDNNGNNINNQNRHKNQKTFHQKRIQQPIAPNTSGWDSEKTETSVP